MRAICHQLIKMASCCTSVMVAIASVKVLSSIIEGAIAGISLYVVFVYSIKGNTRAATIPDNR